MATNEQPSQIFALMARKPGVSFEFFKDYYENSHIPMVNKLIDGDKYIAAWSRNYIQRSEEDAKSMEGYGDSTAAYEFDAITVVVPKSQELLQELFGKFKEFEDIITNDEMNFCDRTKSKIYFVADVQKGVAK